MAQRVIPFVSVLLLAIVNTQVQAASIHPSLTRNGERFGRGLSPNIPANFIEKEINGKVKRVPCDNCKKARTAPSIVHPAPQPTEEPQVLPKNTCVIAVVTTATGNVAGYAGKRGLPIQDDSGRTYTYADKVSQKDAIKFVKPPASGNHLDLLSVDNEFFTSSVGQWSTNDKGEKVGAQYDLGFYTMGNELDEVKWNYDTTSHRLDPVWRADGIVSQTLGNGPVDFNFWLISRSYIPTLRVEGTKAGTPPPPSSGYHLELHCSSL
ncbi:hypothetical protein FRC03_003816 [Tulasnella sp. 419]|nr:hypothetical protein FRC03_003816 [Tulasnella sp. 419]